MSFIIKHGNLSIHYTLPESGVDFEKFKNYLERFTGKKAPELVVRFIDAEGDLTEVKDEYDFEYFIENCQLCDIVLEVAIKTNIPEIIKPSVPISETPPPITLSNTQEAKIDDQKPLVQETQQAECEPLIQIDEPIEQINPADIGMGMVNIDNSFSMSEFDHHQNLEIEKKTEQQIDPNLNLLDQLLKKHPDFIAIENQLSELQSLLISKIEKANIGLEEVTKTKPAPPVVVVKSGLDTCHAFIHCSSCHSSPIIGKRYACIQCPDFNLCEECHVLTQQHPHQMVVLAEADTKVSEINSIYSVLSRVNANPDDNCVQVKMDILKLFTGSSLGKDFSHYFLDGREKMPNGEFLKGVCNFFK